MALLNKFPELDDVAPVLEPLGFSRHGTVLIRESDTLQQLVGTVTSRFDRQQFWVETVLRLLPAKQRIRSLTGAQSTPETVVSLRLDALGPAVPPYFDRNAPARWVGHLSQVLVPFLESTKTVAEAIDELGRRGGYDLALAEVCAKIGDIERARTLFENAPGDRAAIARVAAQHGIRLDKPSS